jgi:hypothetical protein
LEKKKKKKKKMKKKKINGAHGTDKNVLSYTRQKLIISATTLPNLKKM